MSMVVYNWTSNQGFPFTLKMGLCIKSQRHILEIKYIHLKEHLCPRKVFRVFTECTFSVQLKLQLKKNTRKSDLRLMLGMKVIINGNIITN